ncbi:molybdopterin-dependent oxidoreductase [Thermodesulfobacteriota bacterium]
MDYERHDRLRYPLKKTGEGWEGLSWEQALTEIAQKMDDLKIAHGPSSK